MMNAAIADWIMAGIAMTALIILGVIGSSWMDVAGIAALFFFISGCGHLAAVFIEDHR